MKYIHKRKLISANHFLTTKKWDEKEGNSFDVTMGAYCEAKICELAGSFLPHQPPQKLDKTDFSLGRDDGLTLLKSISGP